MIIQKVSDKNHSLNIKSKEVIEIPDKFIAKMSEHVLKTQCSALSAIQFGEPIRMFIIKYDNQLITFINPKVLMKKGKQVSKETCLSVPGLRTKVVRSRVVIIEAMDLEYRVFRFKAKGRYAAVMEHEMDHLNGILIKGDSK